MPIIWNPYLVALSILVAIFGSFTALAHAKRMRENTGRAALIWMTAGGVTLGLAIWAMHFIGMLAFHLAVPVSYSPQFTLLSVLPAVAAALLGFYLLRSPTMKLGQIAGGGLIMGLGISVMHYTGMAAMEMSPPIVYDPIFVFASVGVAVLAAYGALLIVYAGEKYQLPPLVHYGLGGGVMGLAISGMHYTAMAGTNFPLGSVCTGDGSRIDPALLTLFVSTGVFFLLGGGLLASLFDQRIARQNSQALAQLQKLHWELGERAHAMAITMTEELRLHKRALDSISQGVLIANAERHVIYVNNAFEHITGYNMAELIGKSCAILQGVGTNPETATQLRIALNANQPFHDEILNYRKDGTPFWNELAITPVHNNEGRLTHFVSVQRDITKRRQAAQRELIRNQVLEKLSSGAPLPDVLEALVRSVETSLFGALCSILLLDETGRHLLLGAAPSLPDEYNRAIHGITIGPGAGSCGTAAFHSKRVIVSDISSDPLWADYRALALRFGLQACWSQPILSSTGQVLGTFAVYYKETRTPSDTELATISDAANIADIAIEHVHAQQALRIAATAFETQEGIIVTDSNKTILRINHAFTRIYGYTIEDVIGTTPSTLQSGLHDDEFYGAMWEKVLHNKHWAGEIWDKRKNGEIFPAWLTISAVTADDGSVTHYLGTFSDITDYKHTQDELQRHRGHLQELVDEKTLELRKSEAAAKHALIELNQQKYALDQHSIVAVTNMQGRITYVNDKLCDISGYNRKELLGQDHILLNSGYHPHGFFKEMYRSITHGITWHGEICNRAKAGHLYWMDTTIVPFMDGNGNPQQYIAIRTDITERKQIELALITAKNKADLASRAKSEFLATMSHETRPPMSGVIGMIDVLHQTSLKGYQVEMVDIIRDSAFSLLNIIEDILDFSKIEAGKLEIEHEPTAVAEVIEKVCAMLDHLAEKKEVELILFTDPMIPTIVLSDAQRLRQIVVNLANNAIKFSSGQNRTGRVSVQAVLVERDAAQATLEIRIADNGIGMDETTQARLFMPFTQADASTTRRFGGTGLGLTIARNLIQLMGGEITVQSAPGQGSTFTVCLPVVPVSDKENLSATPSLVAGLSCLVVGGTDGLADHLAAYLLAAGAMVEQVPNLAAAREQAGTPSSKPWIWLIDAGNTPPSPDELFATISAQPERDVRLVVIGRGKCRRPRRQDADQIVVVDGNVLTRQTVIQSVTIAAGRAQAEIMTMPSGKGVAAFIAPSRASALQQERLILVAEDNETNQKVILQQLALLGFAADIANDGYEALKRWRSGDYALLLTDLHMPRMDGYELATAIRAEENIKENFNENNAKHTIIIALTANALKGEAMRCHDVGMDDYLSKPTPLADLKATLLKWLPPTELTPQPADTATLAETSLTVAAQSASSSPLDVSVLAALVGDDPAVISDFLQDFWRSTTQIASELKTACTSGQAAQASAAAHKLKSSARSVGALALGDLCAEIEQVGKAGKIEVLTLLLFRFEAEMAAVEKYLDSLSST